MFRTHYDSMRPGPTPERVLAIVRMIVETPLSIAEISSRCQFDVENALVTEAVNRSISTAEELHLIERHDGLCLFTADKKVIESPEAFRKYVSKYVFSNAETSFFKATQWFVSSNEKILGYTSFNTYSAEMNKAGLDGIKENDVLGWRFWLRFLGIAYQYRTTLIPNMAVRLQDAMQNFPRNVEVSADEYLHWLKENVPEVAQSCSQHQLCLAVSNGLRTLEDMDKIELISVMDANKVGLFPLPGVIKNDFSKIIVKEGLNHEMA